jgi:hypothetical protein
MRARERRATVAAAAHARLLTAYKARHASASFVDTAFSNVVLPALTPTAGGSSKQMKLGGRVTANLLAALRALLPDHPASVTFTLAELDSDTHRRFIADLLVLTGQHPWAPPLPMPQLSLLSSASANRNERRISEVIIDESSDEGGSPTAMPPTATPSPMAVLSPTAVLSPPTATPSPMAVLSPTAVLSPPTPIQTRTTPSKVPSPPPPVQAWVAPSDLFMRVALEHVVAEHRGAQQRLALIEDALRVQSLQACLHKQEALLLAAELTTEEATASGLRLKVELLEAERRRERKKKSELTARCAALEMALDAATRGVLAGRARR